ncbi:MAG: VCBS repeat-containing protein [Acidobacteriota bacterium]|nr:VCBS repeat-containing protein [Acidobacteriota bacterium]
MVATEHLDVVLAALLPSESSAFGETVYFPQVEPTVLERWDLAALLDTGLAWEALGSLADDEVGSSPDAIPMSDAAARALAKAVNAYGLLVFRLGGEHAAAQLAPYARSAHLRDAAKTISARAGREASPIRTPSPEAGDATLFTDVSDALGLEYRHVSSDWLSQFRRYGPIAPTFSGGGVAAGDINGDSWEDLVVCGGKGCVALLNRAGKAFEDATRAAGVGIEGEARAPLLADFDNDSDLDLFVTYVRDSNRLFVNDGRGHFSDFTAAAGLYREGDISGPATTADVNGDGLLDLYVGNFGDYLSGASAWAARDSKNAMPNRLYVSRSRSPLRFEEVDAGADDEGWAQALSHFDYDMDGDQDFYIANDFGRNELLQNDGHGNFTRVGERTGTDDPNHGMNVAFADLNKDQRPDILVTNIWFWAAARREVVETNSLLLSVSHEGRVRYEHSQARALLDYDSSWAWAALFFDVDNDADDDLFVANGFTDYMTFVQYREHPEIPGQLYAINNGRTPNLFFRGNGDGMPSELVRDSGVELAGVNSRSAALLDFDRDGDLDLAVTSFHDRLRLFRNDAGRGRALAVTLVGDPARGSSRDAVGAVVIARAPGSEPAEGGLLVWRAVQGGEGYLGMSTLPLEIGAGSHETVDLEVIWPGGGRQRLTGVQTGQAVRIEQALDVPTRLWLFPPAQPILP